MIMDATSEAAVSRLGDTTAQKRHRRKLKKPCQVTPYKNFPTEIWMYILKLYCQSGRLSTSDTSQPPVILTQVCSAWRRLVLAMPRLWSNVHIGEHTSPIRMWLERAGNIPRGIETSTDIHCVDSNQRAKAIQSLVCSFPLRKLHLTDRDAFCMDFWPIRKSLLLLEDLAIVKSFQDPVGEVLHLRNVPNIVSLRINTVFMPDFHVHNPFSTWKKLRVLWLDWCGLSVGDCLDIFGYAPSIEDCTLYLDSCALGHSRSVEHASLKILRLSTRTSTFRIFLDRIICSNLHTLVLSSPYSPHDPLDPDTLLRLAQRTGSLRSLDIHHFYKSIDISLVLNFLPLLQVLQTHCESITTEIAAKIGNGELGGCLRELRDWNSDWKICNHNLYKMLRICELRQKVTRGQAKNGPTTIARLEKVSVRSYWNVVESKAKQRICRLTEHGIEFKVFQDHSGKELLA